MTGAVQIVFILSPLADQSSRILRYRYCRYRVGTGINICRGTTAETTSGLRTGHEGAAKPPIEHQHISGVAAICRRDDTYLADGGVAMRDASPVVHVSQ